MNTNIILTLSAIIIGVGQTQDARTLPDGVYEKGAACIEACVGLRDLGCPDVLANGRAVCHCQAGYYNNKEHCENECEYQQFWSLFTYGKCVEYTTPAGYSQPVGLCNKMCAFRVRVWATVFIIILFTSGKQTCNVSTFDNHSELALQGKCQNASIVKTGLLFLSCCLYILGSVVNTR